MSIEIKNGILTSLTTNGKHYAFRNEPEYAGPVFHIVYAGQERVGNRMTEQGDGWFGVYFWGVRMAQKVEATRDGLRIHVKMRNGSSQPFRPDRVSLMLGIDTYMDSYPEWNDILFPTLLRCEKTHLWGYFASPSGCLLGIACPDPVTSWALEYNHFFCDNGHRIYTARLDLLNMEKQPERHPVMDCLMPGEEKRWTIDLFDAPDLTELLKKCSLFCQAPVFHAQRLVLAHGEEQKVLIYSETLPVSEDYPTEIVGDHVYAITLKSGDQPGVRRLIARAQGHESELIWYQRKDWSFYLDAARQAAWDKPQKTGSHSESWYGLYSAFQAARFLPKPELDAQFLKEFEELLPLAFDPEKGIPILEPNRIQNTAVVVGLCEDAWRITNDIKWIETGARFADYLIDHCQNDEGVFCNLKAHYTCVICIAKCILELWRAETEQEGEEWKKRAEKHFAASKRAIDELVLHLDNIGTEGEHTFDDGMISCAMTQIALMGLLLPEDQRAPYIQAAEIMLKKHRCLERLESPDARSRNTTLRFWEAQYDVLIPTNMINSPHGWSAWKIYGVWYLYLLTGKTEYLTDTMETLGSCVQLMDLNGTLRWSFVPDPCIVAGKWKPDANGYGRLTRETFGETYMDMISGWYRAPKDTPIFAYLADYPGFDTDEGGCCDNDVHECFKALSEVALPYGYIYAQGDTLCALNGTLREDGDTIFFTPPEPVVQAVHVNLPREKKVVVAFASGTKEQTLRFGWVQAEEVKDTVLPLM